MEPRDYTRILSRISAQDADDLDDMLAADAPRAARNGAVLFPRIEAQLAPRVAFRRADAVCVGFHLTPAADRAADRAVRFAAMALERDVEVVVMAEEDTSGLERFGFRVERVAGDDGGAACIDQLRRFWGLDLVLRA